MKQIETLILTMLTAGHRHGYGIRQDIIEHTGGRVALEAGNLYRHIRDLEEAALIAPAAAPDGDDRLIYYRLLPAGKRALAAELAAMRDLVRFAESHGVAVPTRAAQR